MTAEPRFPKLFRFCRGVLAVAWLTAIACVAIALLYRVLSCALS